MKKQDKKTDRSCHIKIFKKVDLISSKSDASRLDITNLQAFSTELNNLESDVGKSDVDKLKPALVS